ncbi:MAG: hypothetical protein EBZ77_06985 [Chitinophagia bacterium]|nr:hypothetical protein [Chitinophagia bacterium]
MLIIKSGSNAGYRFCKRQPDFFRTAKVCRNLFSIARMPFFYVIFFKSGSDTHWKRLFNATNPRVFDILAGQLLKIRHFVASALWQYY